MPYARAPVHGLSRVYDQPTAEQRQEALKWIDEPISKMDEVINALGPLVGP